MTAKHHHTETPLPFGAVDGWNNFALRQVRPPIKARLVARVMLAVFIVTAIALVFVPWQQSLSASGRVTAYDPILREQVIQAPITGRIIKIHVVEGQKVKGRKLDDDGKVIPGYEGTVLVSIRDPDPNLMVCALVSTRRSAIKGCEFSLVTAGERGLFPHTTKLVLRRKAAKLLPG